MAEVEVARVDGVLHAVKGDADGGGRAAGVGVQSGAVIKGLGALDGGPEGLSSGGGTDQEGRAGVNDGLGALEESSAADVDGAHLDLPVTLYTPNEHLV